MLTGTIFDLNEFAVHDGPGVRAAVFLKGCPLRCQWCHNPEGQSAQPETLRAPTGARTAGERVTSAELARRVNRLAEALRAGQGGVTFTGGEPLMQAEFVSEVIDQLEGLHVLLETCGHGGPAELERLLGRVDLVYYDLKLIDPEMHRHYTGQDNRLILDNLRRVSDSGVPFVARVPLIPGVTDTLDNQAGIAAALRGLPGLLRVELLPYNRAAGAKYRALGRAFQPEFDEDRLVAAAPGVFAREGIEVRVA